MSELEKKIEALIFYKGEEITFKELSSILKVSEDEIKNDVQNIQERYLDSGIKIITTEKSVLFSTGEEVAGIIEDLEKEEYEKDLSKAALETLTIILYRGPLKRSMIDYIRGVNSQFTLRNLLIRGLIEKETDPKDERAYLYRASSDLLRFMNVDSVKDLQEYGEINEKIDAFIKHSEKDDE
jgi:segregation and condensation protein B